MKTLNTLALSLTLSLTAIGCSDSPSATNTPTPPPTNPKPNPTDANSLTVPACPILFSNSNYCAKLSWIEGPSLMAESQLWVFLWSKEHGSSEGPYHDPADNVELGLDFTMPDHGGHGLHMPLTFEKVGRGVYRATDVNLSMSGYWKIHLYFSTPSKGNIDEANSRVDL